MSPYFSAVSSVMQIKSTKMFSFIRSEVEAKEYDARKLKESQDALMTHYEGQLKSKTEELSLAKRETQKIRETMANSTPSKRSDGGHLEKEVKVLRDELMKKTEFIKHLESMIPDESMAEATKEEVREAYFKL